MRRDVFQAIADPTRRAIIGMIALQSMNINAVAGKFDVSRTAIYTYQDPYRMWPGIYQAAGT